MCVYSAYVDQMRPAIWPKPDPWQQQTNPYKQTPGINPFLPLSVITDPVILQEIKALGKRLDAIDKALGLKDCSQEEASKREFERQLDALIDTAKKLKDEPCGKLSVSPEVTS